MASGPAPFSEFGRRARDLLTRDYNYDQKFSLSIPNSTGMGLTATGIKKNQIFVGDISTQFKSEKTTVYLKVDTYSNVSTMVTYDVKPGTKTTVSFNIPDQKSGKVPTLRFSVLLRHNRSLFWRLSVRSYSSQRPTPSLRSTTASHFLEPLGRLDVHYLHHHAAINSSIGLNPNPLLEVSAAIGSKDIAIGGEIGFDTASSSITKCNTGISFTKPDFSASVIFYTGRTRAKL